MRCRDCGYTVHGSVEVAMAKAAETHHMKTGHVIEGLGIVLLEEEFRDDRGPPVDGGYADGKPKKEHVRLEDFA